MIDINKLIKQIDKGIISIVGLREELNMLADENFKMAEYLLDDGYTTDDVNNIAMGYPIDSGVFH